MTDRWAAWLLERRHGGDEQRLRELLEQLREWRDRVLDNARLGPDDVVLDAGCGDGLIAFDALERGAAKVIFSDVSAELLDVCREIAAGDPRCEFVFGSVDELPLPDESVDVATTRSVLIYVEDKLRTLRELHRVLRPGGRLSIFEPINSFAYPQPEHRFAFWDVSPVVELSNRMKAHYRSVAPDQTLIDFDERDLVRWAEEAGFGEVRLDYEVRIAPGYRVANWEAYERSSGNPLAPTLRETADDALGPEDAERFLGHLRAENEAGRGIDRYAVAFLWAVKR
ncbi:MAG: methyltransferase domain-containing protein [Gaiellaceae bacterium]